jgi:hypothetical protein
MYRSKRSTAPLTDRDEGLGRSSRNPTQGSYDEVSYNQNLWMLDRCEGATYLPH